MGAYDRDYWKTEKPKQSTMHNKNIIDCNYKVLKSNKIYISKLKLVLICASFFLLGTIAVQIFNL